MTEPELVALLQQLQRGLPPTVQDRCDELIEQRRCEKLSDDELAELMRLTDQVEKNEADRLALLARLAQLRKRPLAEVAQEFRASAQAGERRPWAEKDMQ